MYNRTFVLQSNTLGVYILAVTIAAGSIKYKIKILKNLPSCHKLQRVLDTYL